MSFNNRMNNLERGLEIVEYGCNFVDIAPVASIFSSALRAVIGKVQIIAGLGGTLFYGVQYLADNRRIEQKQKALRCFSHVVHGAGNIVRAAAVVVLANKFFPFGLAILIPAAFGKVLPYNRKHFVWQQ
jgi:hypothetical protein